MKATAKNESLGNLLNGIGEGRIVPNPDFQRRLVWSQKHKTDLVDTVLRGYPFPEVYFFDAEVDVDTGVAKVWIVDGQQRLTTLHEYFTAAKTIKATENVPLYSQLDDAQKRKFLSYKVVVRQIEAEDIDEVKEVFKRINSTSYNLNDTERANSEHYDNELWNFCLELSADDFFEDRSVFTSSDFKRMLDIRFCLSFVVTMMGGYFNLESKHQDFLERFNEGLPELEDLTARFKKVKSFLEFCDFSEDSRIWKKADLFTAIVEIDRALGQGTEIDPSSFKSVFDSLGRSIKLLSSEDEEDRKALANQLVFDFLTIETVERYSKAAIQGTNSRSNRNVRGEIIAELIDLCKK